MQLRVRTFEDEILDIGCRNAGNRSDPSHQNPLFRENRKEGWSRTVQSRCRHLRQPNMYEPQTVVDACERGASYATPAVSTAKEDVGRRLSRLSDLFFSLEASDFVEDILV
jgi:hypothetical protein